MSSLTIKSYLLIYIIYSLQNRYLNTIVIQMHYVEILNKTQFRVLHQYHPLSVKFTSLKQSIVGTPLNENNCTYKSLLIQWNILYTTKAFSRYIKIFKGREIKKLVFYYNFITILWKMLL